MNNLKEQRMNKMTIRDARLAGKRVLVRVDYNVPLDAQSNITDDKRIAATLPTISALLEKGAAIILMSHLGRPQGRVKPELSLKPVAVRLSELLGRTVSFSPDCTGENVAGMAAAMKPGDVMLLENLRFHPEERSNDSAFAKALASLAEVYVNDAFGTAHRVHASIKGVTAFLSPCLAGLLMEKEIDYLGRAIDKPARPYTAILGGAKVSEKIDVIQNLMETVDTLLIGGGMMFTFFKAQGLEIGSSLLEDDKVELAAEILAAAKRDNKRLLLPLDTIAALDFSNDTDHAVVSVDAIPKDRMGLDIGPETIALFGKVIRESRTVIWNGPMGVFEMPTFAEGTFAVARALADATREGAITIIGGGDSASAVKKAGLEEKVSHVSTGGGASLELLEGKILPGLAALTDNAEQSAHS